MKLIKLLFTLIKTDILLLIHKLRTKSYLVTYSMLFKNSSEQIIISCPMNITGKITWCIIEALQKKFLKIHEDYRFCTILGFTKLKKIK